ncbi:MAG: hypothetical protein C0418_00020 [Coriobacteriaceae bacterium]|nr:hypothetical protein [Coriobacteriaceae bacterium]
MDETLEEHVPPDPETPPEEPVDLVAEVETAEAEAAEPDEPLEEAASDPVTAEQAPEEAEAETAPETMPGAEEPETAEAETPPDAPEPAPTDAPEPVQVVVAAGIPKWPFVVYVAVWAVYAASGVTVLFSNPAASPVESAYYGPLLLGGLALAMLGPVLALIVWMRTRATTPQHLRHGLFVTALVRGAAATFAGVALWVVGLIMLDALRLGWL